MVVFFLVGVCLVLAEIGALGPVGRSLATALNTVFGVGRVALAVSLVGLAIALVLGKIEFDRARFSWKLARCKRSENAVRL